MYRNYDKNKNNNSTSSDIFNQSGQNIMTNRKNLDYILNENKRLKIEINKKNKEIEDAKKKIKYSRKRNTKCKKTK